MISESVSIVVVGASGDLARTKIFPALFALYCHNCLPKDFNIFGFARTSFNNDEFRAKIAEHLTCRYVPEKSCSDRMSDFISRCYYVTGQYDSSDKFLSLEKEMQKKEDDKKTNRIFYLAIPPSVFLDVARAIGNAGLARNDNNSSWSRVIIEKPFGRDRESSDLLTRELSKVFTEDQIYRIDHYLGKEVIQNLMVLRFANLIFEPIWNRSYVERISINWKEDIGVGSRGGYFDHYGIIRDVVQNHLLQILALVAMENPISRDAEYVRDEKVKVLKCIEPLTLDNIIIGQYGRGYYGANNYSAYIEEDSIPDNSLTPTYFGSVLCVNNARWDGVPFIISAGKGLNAGLTEVRIRFHEPPGNIFCDSKHCMPSNEFIIRIQPDEGLYLSIINKDPGLDLKLTESELNLKYQSAFKKKIPDAYECLLLDVMQGDKSLFIRSDELMAAWDIFTPVLHELEKRAVKPELYEFGSTGIMDSEMRLSELINKSRQK